jgi:hypothetical protein
MTVYKKALNGTGNYELQLDVWTKEQDEANNKSYVRWELRVVRISGLQYSSGFQNPWSVDINGATASGTKTFNFISGGNTLSLGGGGTWVTHNSDGTKTISVSGTFEDIASNNQVGDGTVTGSYGLPDIARASTPRITDTANVTDTHHFTGQTIRVHTDRASTSFTHTAQLIFGDTTVTLGTGISTSVDYTLPHSLLSEMPDTDKMVGTIRLTTFSGGKSIGSIDRQITIYVPTNILPTFTSATLSEGNTVAGNSGVGAYIQNVSQFAYSFSGAAGIYGSTIATYEVKVGSVTGRTTTPTGVTPPIPSSGSVTVTATVTDTRGQKFSRTYTATVLAYSPPTITNAAVARTNSVGAFQEDGTYAKATFAASVQSLVSGTQKNTYKYTIYTRKTGTTTWTSRSTAGPTTGTSFSVAPNFGTFPVAESYDVLFEVEDKFNKVSTTRTISIATIFMHWAENLGMGVGKFWSQGSVDAMGQMYQNNGEPVRSDTATPYVDSIRTTAASIPNNAWQALNIAVSETLNYSGVTISGATVTIQRAGIYILSAAVKWASATGGTSRGLAFSLSTVPGQVAENNLRLAQAYLAGTLPLSTSWVGRLPAGTTVQLVVIQNSGASVNVSQSEFGLGYLGKY